MQMFLWIIGFCAKISNRFGICNIYAVVLHIYIMHSSFFTSYVLLFFIKPKLSHGQKLRSSTWFPLFKEVV